MSSVSADLAWAAFFASATSVMMVIAALSPDGWAYAFLGGMGSFATCWYYLERHFASRSADGEDDRSADGEDE